MDCSLGTRGEKKPTCGSQEPTSASYPADQHIPIDLECSATQRVVNTHTMREN